MEQNVKIYRKVVATRCHIKNLNTMSVTDPLEITIIRMFRQSFPVEGNNKIWNALYEKKDDLQGVH